MRSGLTFSSFAASTTSGSTSPSISASMSLKSSSASPGFLALRSSLPFLPLGAAATGLAAGLTAPLPWAGAAGLAAGLTGASTRAAALACGCLGADAGGLAGFLVVSACALFGLAAGFALGACLAAGFFAFMRFLYRVSGGGRPDSGTQPALKARGRPQPREWPQGRTAGSGVWQASSRELLEGQRLEGYVG